VRLSNKQLTSASHCTDYQSRRLGIKYRPRVPAPAKSPDDIPVPPHLEATAILDHSDGRPPKTLYAHTLNATAAAIPRLIVALVENGVQLDPTSKELFVELPRVLKDHWVGPVDEQGVRSSDGRHVVRWK
jgi:seryl-tRNA synthetase